MHHKSLPAIVLFASLAVFGLASPNAFADARLAPQEATAGGPPDPSTPAGMVSEAAKASEGEKVEWLTDDQGNKYRVQKLEKGVEGRDWIWVGENRVQVRYGIQYDIVSHDADSFSIKLYERINAEVKSPAQLERERKEREAALQKRREEVLASYEVDLATSDRLRLEPFDEGLPDQGQWRNGFDLGDMNGDGHVDIVFGAARKSYPARPNIFLGNGEGQWWQWREARYPSLPFDYGDAAVADFNGDGHLDLALGIHLKGILVMVGDGQGKFTPWSMGIGLEVPGQGGDASTFSSRALEVADWNGDGKVDLLALGEGPKGIARVVAGEGQLKTANGPVFFMNNGNGSWRVQGQPSKIFGDAVSMGDFNGDGRADFVTSSNSANHSIVNIGDGEEGWITHPVAAARPRSYMRAVASGRLDGDEIDDLVVGYVGRELKVWRSGVDLYFGTRDLEWKRQPLFVAEGKQGIYGLATGDLDGDGHRDVAVATGNMEVLLYLGDGSGTFTREESTELPEPIQGCRGYGLRLQDLDGDGRDELIVGFAGERGGGASLGGTVGCPQGGSVRAWSPALNEGQASSNEGQASSASAP